MVWRGSSGEKQSRLPDSDLSNAPARPGRKPD